MASKRYTHIRTSTLEAFQHARDNYWYRPVVFGKNLFTYIAYVPPGGSMPPHGHEEDPYELSLVMLQGELQIMLDGDTFVASEGDAVHVEPTVSLGVHNVTDRTAAFALTFNPPPPSISSIDAVRERYKKRGSGIMDVAEIEALITSGRTRG